jgi:hypothetical protein
MKVQASASAETAFSLCQFAPAPVVWIPQLDQGSKLGKQQRIQPEVLCNEGNPIQEVRYLLDGDLVETAKAPSFSHQLLTEKLARGEHELQADVLLGDGTRISSGPATFKLSGNAFNPAYLLLVLALGLVIVGGFVMASRRRAERHSSDLPRPPMPPASAPLPSPQPAVPAAPQASSPLPARAPKLRVVTGPNEGQTYELGNTVTLGRSPGVGVLLSGSSVSREHARIVRRGPLYQLRDLGSTNGTRINGRRIAEATLTPGDRIEISPYVLLFDA